MRTADAVSRFAAGALAHPSAFATEEVEAMATRPLYPSDLKRLTRLLREASLELGIEKGATEADALAAKIMALDEVTSDDAELLRLVVAMHRREQFHLVGGERKLAS
jgi:hypothetical protein